MSSGSRFEGKWLSEYLEDYHNIYRKEDEDDWTLRKRAFAEVFSNDPVAAVEFLYGRHHDELSPAEKMTIATLTVMQPSSESLKKFSDNYNVDPLITRKTKK